MNSKNTRPNAKKFVAPPDSPQEVSEGASLAPSNNDVPDSASVVSRSIVPSNSFYKKAKKPRNAYLRITQKPSAHNLRAMPGMSKRVVLNLRKGLVNPLHRPLHKRHHAKKSKKTDKDSQKKQTGPTPAPATSQYNLTPKMRTQQRQTPWLQQQQLAQQHQQQQQQQPQPQPIKLITSKTSSGFIPVTPKSESLNNFHRLLRDGRKTPDQYRQLVQHAQSPEELSLKSITEHYNVPDSHFNTPEDVFHYRGYKKLAKLDEGAFGIVSKAFRYVDRSFVAVKEVDLRRKRAKRIEEMKRELFVLQKIESSYVVKLIEHFIMGQTLVIIMEFCAGSNLTTYLKETAISESEAVHLFKQMAAAIKVLHRKGIAHRDVKLNNFLLDATRKIVKVGDFGLSVVSYKPSFGIMMAKTYCGTEPYMAPELLKRNSLGVRSYNPLYSDVWSLGICLFAMLTRTFPFKMNTSQQGLFQAQTARKWRFPRRLRESLSEEIKDLVWHMLDPEPERRITITGVMSHPWLNHYSLVALSYDESDAP